MQSGLRQAARALFLFEEQQISNSGQCRADDRGNPKQPELLQRPPVHEERWSRAAGGIHRQVVNRYADQVNKREAKADGNSGEALRRATIRGWRIVMYVCAPLTHATALPTGTVALPAHGILSIVRPD